MNPVDCERGKKLLRMQKQKQNGRGDCPTREPIMVFCRVRPLSRSSAASCVKVIPPNIVRLMSPYSGKEMRYTFKEVFNEKTSQKSLFDTVALPLVTDVLNGKNGLLFSYGVTGSGKTFTMTGNDSNAGMMPRCLDVIFNSIKDRQADKFLFKPDRMNGFEVQSETDALSDRQSDFLAKINAGRSKRLKKTDSDPDLDSIEPTSIHLPDGFMYSVFVTYIEVYNNTVYDLLEDAADDRRPLQRKITREDAAHNMYVHCVTEVEVTSAEEAFDVFLKGQKKKRMAQTLLNAESSRSHSVFGVRVVQAPVNFGKSPNSRSVNIAQLSLVDLAGSERTNRTGNTGARLREAGNINNSLMTLRACLELLRENQATGSNKMIPYREAKITHLFKSFFEGDGRVAMVVCINPSEDDYDENLHVLKFAEMSQEVQVTAPITHRYNLETPRSERAGNDRRRKMAVEDDIESEIFATPKRKKGIALKLLQDLPDLELKSPSDSATLPNLIAYLETSVVQLDEFIAASKQKGAELVAKVNSTLKEYPNLVSENNYLKNISKREQQEKLAMESRQGVLETENGVLKRKIEDKENTIKKLRREVVEKDNKLSHMAHNSEKVKEIYSNKIVQAKSAMEHKIEKKYLSQKSQMEIEMKRKQNQIEQMKRILSDEALDRGCQTPSSQTSSVPSVVTRSAHVFGSTRHYPQPSVTPATPQLHFSRRMGIPVSNRRHRRSKSAGDVWLDHRPQHAVPLDTVLQPTMERRKSVTKLKDVKDLTEKTSKYCLMTQAQDSDGDLETRLYKGDIVPTSGGGAQVMFNDVEVLRQISPVGPGPRTHRRSRSETGPPQVPPKPVSEICSIAIEGHRK